MDSVCEGAGARGVPAAVSWTAAAVSFRCVWADGGPGELHHTPDRLLDAVPADHDAGGDAGAAAAPEAGEPDPVSAAAGAVRVLLCDAAPGDVSVSVLRLRSADGVGGAARRTPECDRGRVEGGLAHDSGRPEEAAVYPGGTACMDAVAGAGGDVTGAGDAPDGRKSLAPRALGGVRSGERRVGKECRSRWSPQPSKRQ